MASGTSDSLPQPDAASAAAPDAPLPEPSQDRPPSRPPNSSQDRPDRFADPHVLNPGPPWRRLPELEPGPNPAPSGNPTSGQGGVKRGRGRGHDWAEVARLLSDGHHPIVIANLTCIPLHVIRRQLKRSRHLRARVEELRRVNADHIGWRVQALRNELAESLSDAVRKGDRTLVRWLAQELGLAHVPATDPAGAPPEPKARNLAGRYDPSAIAEAARPAAPDRDEREEHGTYNVVMGDWDEHGNWLDPRTRDHVRQVWYGPDGRKTVTIHDVGVTGWREFIQKRLGKAEAEGRITTERVRAIPEADVARRQAGTTWPRGSRPQTPDPRAPILPPTTG